MFAVPGWTVSPGALTTQTAELSRPRAEQAAQSSDPESAVKKHRDKKRKRPSGQSKSTEVNSTTLSDLWDTVIDQRDAGKDLGPRKKRRQKKLRTSEDVDKGTSGLAVDTKASQKGNYYSKGQIQDVKRKNILQKLDVITEGKIMVAENMAPELPSPINPSSHLTPLQHSMRDKLLSARFRHLNQTLYTNPSALSLQLFHENPEMFNDYHSGFRRQVEVWPENPLDGYLEQIRQRGMRGSATRKATIGSITADGGLREQVLPLPRTDGICYIADLGCGDAGLSQGLENVKKRLKLQFFSCDLQSPNAFVTKADMADLPLKDGCVDVAIFCLALMGINWIDFVEEAFRILRWKGELWIAEIKSRFARNSSKSRRVDHSVGNKKRSITTKEQLRYESDADVTGLFAEVDGQENNRESTDVSDFVEVLRKRGFILQERGGLDLSNRMFVKMIFLKGQTPIKGRYVSIPKGMSKSGTWRKKSRSKFVDDTETSLSSEATVLKPCLYKQR